MKQQPIILKDFNKKDIKTPSKKEFRNSFKKDVNKNI